MIDKTYEEYLQTFIGKRIIVKDKDGEDLIQVEILNKLPMYEKVGFEVKVIEEYNHYPELDKEKTLGFSYASITEGMSLGMIVFVEEEIDVQTWFTSLF